MTKTRELCQRIISQHSANIEAELKQIIPLFAATPNEKNLPILIKKCVKLHFDIQTLLDAEKEKKREEQKTNSIGMDVYEKEAMYSVLQDHFLKNRFLGTSAKIRLPKLTPDKTAAWLACIDILQNFSHPYRCCMENIFVQGSILSHFLALVTSFSPEDREIERKKPELNTIVKKAAIACIHPDLQVIIKNINTLKKYYMKNIRLFHLKH